MGSFSYRVLKFGEFLITLLIAVAFVITALMYATQLDFVNLEILQDIEIIRHLGLAGYLLVSPIELLIDFGANSKIINLIIVSVIGVIFFFASLSALIQMFKNGSQQIRKGIWKLKLFIYWFFVIAFGVSCAFAIKQLGEIEADDLYVMFSLAFVVLLFFTAIAQSKVYKKLKNN